MRVSAGVCEPFLGPGSLGSTYRRSQGGRQFNSLAVDSAGRPHIAYANVKSESSGLRYAVWNGKSWDAEIIEGAGGPVPIFAVVLVVDKDNNPHIAYSQVQTGIVKYATKIGGKWVTQPVDAIKGVAYPDWNGLVLDGKGNPYISYYDSRAGILKSPIGNAASGWWKRWIKTSRDSRVLWRSLATPFGWRTGLKRTAR